MTRVRLFYAHARQGASRFPNIIGPDGSRRSESSGEMASVTEADDLAVVEVVVLPEFLDTSGVDPEVDVAE